MMKWFDRNKYIDFDEIFSPVVKMSSIIRVVFALAASMDFEGEQLDVKIFQHGDLTICMEQPKGFEIKGKEHMVCKLKKRLKGLKQALRQWYKKFYSLMGNDGYKKLVSNHCVFIQRFDNGNFIILLLYVDDMLIVRHDRSKIGKLKENLRESFALKDLGFAKQILGIYIQCDWQAKKLWVSLEKCIEKVIQRFNMKDAKPVGVPLRSHFKLKKMDLNENDVKEM